MERTDMKWIAIILIAALVLSGTMIAVIGTAQQEHDKETYTKITDFGGYGKNIFYTTITVEHDDCTVQICGGERTKEPLYFSRTPYGEQTKTMNLDKGSYEVYVTNQAFFDIGNAYLRQAWKE